MTSGGTEDESCDASELKTADFCENINAIPSIGHIDGKYLSDDFCLVL